MIISVLKNHFSGIHGFSIIAVFLFIQLLALRYVMWEHQPFNIVNWPKKISIICTLRQSEKLQNLIST